MRILTALFLLSMVTVPASAQRDFSLENAKTTLHTLSVDIGPRPMGSPAERRALEFAAAKFKEYGCDTSYIMPMPHSTYSITTSGIAVGIRRGTSGRIICIGGHIDSAGPEIPGADDDGSGTASVIELARVFGLRHMQSTLLFCCFGGEEQGLEGSRYFASHFGEIDSIVMMLQIDMANGIGVIDIDPDDHTTSAPRWLARAGVEKFFSLGYRGLEYPTHFFALNYGVPQGSGSDHESFLRMGVPAIDFSTDVTKPIHTPRDNFENFDPRGLKRTGDVVAALVDKYDGGTPNRTTERYWMAVIGGFPVFISLWILWLFTAAAGASAIIAFVAVRKRREPPHAEGRVRWSTFKMMVFGVFAVACSWFSPDLLGFFKGVRHPAVTDFTLYQLLAAFGLGIGLWVCSKLSRYIRLSRCPYVIFKRAAIWLAFMTICFGLISVKLAIYPAATLLFFSLAMLTTRAAVRIFFSVLAPVPFILFNFHEWYGILAHSFGSIPPLGFWPTAGINAFIIGIYSFYLIPLLFGWAAVVRDCPPLNAAGAWMGSKAALACTVAGYVLLALLLYQRPVYNALWYKDVRLNEQIDMKKHSQDVILESSEYLTGVQLHHEGGDTVINTRTQSFPVRPASTPDTTWFSVDRKEEKESAGDTTKFDIQLTLRTKFRPYTVTVVYAKDGKNPRFINSDLWSSMERAGTTFRWYSFPDTMLVLPVHLQTVKEDSINESIEVTFDTLAYPMKATRELSYFIPRTRYTDEHAYRK